MCFACRKGVSKSTYYRWVDRLKDGIPESLVAEEAASAAGGVEPGDVLAGFSQGIAGRTPIAQWRRGATALGRWPGGFGGSHPRCGRATSLEVTELMNYLTDARIFLCLTPTKMQL